MAKLSILSSDLTEWLNLAVASSTTYFKVRRNLWKRLAQFLDTDFSVTNRVNALGIVANPPVAVKLQSDDLFTVRSYLLMRNDKITDDASLAYQKVLEDWLDL